jgi:hypothetical protein
MRGSITKHTAKDGTPTYRVRITLSSGEES